MPKWTEEQQLAIDKEGTNIIVSAGAGSGKTAVLTARVIRKLSSGIDINKLLILTFTNAAAKEMRERIRSAVKKDPNLKRQLDLIDGAYITTFDSYSLSLVKKYYYLLGVDKNVNIADASVIYTEKTRIIDQIFDSLYESKDKNFLKLIGDFCVKKDDDIKKYILSISDKMDLIYDKELYLDTYINDFYNDDVINKNINKYVDSILYEKSRINELFEELSNYLDSDYLEKLNLVLEPLLIANNYEELKSSLLNLKMPALPRNSDEVVKECKERISKQIKKLQDLTIYEDLSDMKNGILKTEPYALSIVSIIKELTNKLNDFKMRNNVFEFNDISKMAIKILKDNPLVCDEIKYDFKEIMVDEYQDTSNLQEEFISLIENNNVYMVGDIKQSIYRFRNANPYIFKNKYDNYSLGKSGFKIDLNKNFRSRKETLDNINTVFNIIMDDKIGGADYVKSHQMIFGNNVYFEEGKTTQNENFEIYNYNYDKGMGYTRDEIECFIVASDIKKKIEEHYKIFDKDLGILRDCKYSDFVILMDRATEFDLYKKIFEYMNIPLTKYTYTSITGNDDLLVIKNLIELIIKYHNKSFDIDFKYSFTSIARSYLFNYSDSTIFDYLNNANYNDSEIVKLLDDINIDYDNLSIRSLISLLVSKFNFYEKLIEVGSVENSIIRLEYIYNLASNAEAMDYSLEDFSEYLNKLVDEGFDIKVEINDVNPNSVGIMTIHKSKGLEYPICYYTGMSSSFNIRDTMERFIFDNEYGIICPYFENGINKTIYSYLFKEKYIKEDISERIRLFYVALTRCREKMILVGELEDKTINKADSKLNYKSFLDIINSVYSSIFDYVVDIPLSTIEMSKDYNIVSKIDYKEIIPKSKQVISIDNIDMENNLINEKNYSKVSPSLLLESTREKFNLGKKIHYYLECLDFLNPDFTNIDSHYVRYIEQFLELDLDFSNCKIYKEYEFMYNDGSNSGHGIIDLMLVYNDNIKIIDYKLNNIVDGAYRNQLYAYKEYIETKTKKKVTTYLYSVFTGVLKEV